MNPSELRDEKKIRNTDLCSAKNNFLRPAHNLCTPTKHCYHQLLHCLNHLDDDDDDDDGGGGGGDTEDEYDLAAHVHCTTLAFFDKHPDDDED